MGLAREPSGVRGSSQPVDRVSVRRQRWERSTGGIDGTDTDAGKWFSYPLRGRPAIEMVVARNDGDEAISVRVLAGESASDELRTRIGAAAEIFNSYRIR